MSWHFDSGVWSKDQTVLVSGHNRFFENSIRRKSEMLLRQEGVVVNMPIKAKSEPEKKNKPAAEFRAGGVKCTVWANSGKDEQIYYTVDLIRSYKDKEDKWQETSSLRSHDVAKAVMLLGKAFEFINLSRADVREDQ